MDNIHILDEVDNINVAQSFECSINECVSIINKPEMYLKVITQNIRSIYKNFDSFTVLLSTLNFGCDIMILTECWLAENKLLPQLPCYSLHSSNRSINQNDGIVVYCKNSITCSIEEPSFPEANCLVIKIGDHTAIIAIYRLPCFRKLDSLLDSLEAVLSSFDSTKNVIIMGAINININPNTIDINNTSKERMRTAYLDFTTEYGYLPAHYFATRHGNCLDHVLLKTKSQALSLVLQSPLTDHLPVLLCLSTQSDRERPLTTVYKKLDFNNVKKLLKDSNISDILQINDPDLAATTLVEILMNSIQLSTVFRPLPCRQQISKPWISQGLLRCIRHRDNLHLKVKRYSNDQALLKSYRRYRNFCNGLLRKLKLSYERTELEKASKSAKQTWRVIKAITNISQTKAAPLELLKSGLNHQIAVNNVNAYIANVGKSLTTDIARNLNDKLSNVTFRLKRIHDHSFYLKQIMMKLNKLYNL